MPSPALAPLTLAVSVVEALFALGGCVLLWRLCLRPAARIQPAAPALAPWATPLDGFLIFLLCVILGGLILQGVALAALGYFSVAGHSRLMLASGAFHLGMLSGVAGFRLAYPARNPGAESPAVSVLASGLVTFLVSLPPLLLVGLVWQGLLKLAGVPAEKQNLLALFRDTKSPALLAFMIVLAVVVAPVTEELLFRRGLFGWLRTRLPRPAALLLPACLFAALHANLASFAQLVALGVIFSLAYERTGRIGTTMLAHGLFNLNTILLVLAGVGD